MNSERDKYLSRMSDAPQFAHFNTAPQWIPNKNDIWGFIHDEVVRQGHDTNYYYDGGIRIEQMIKAWNYALARQYRPPTLGDIRQIGRAIEPEYNSVLFFRSRRVFVGSREGLPPGEIKRAMRILAAQIPVIRPVQGLIQRFPFPTDVEFFLRVIKNLETADEWYLAFEWIHPWLDGNGRSGKILHNWLLKTLENPVLIANYFGGHHNP